MIIWSPVVDELVNNLNSGMVEQKVNIYKGNGFLSGA